MYSLKLYKQVTKFLKKRDKKELKKIIEKFELLKINPYPSNTVLDIKKLTNYGSNYFRNNNSKG